VRIELDFKTQNPNTNKGHQKSMRSNQSGDVTNNISKTALTTVQTTTMLRKTSSEIRQRGTMKIRVFVKSLEEDLALSLVTSSI